MTLTPFSCDPTAIEGLTVVTLKQVSDERGTVREFFRESTAGSLGLTRFAQVNVTHTRTGALRGLHGEDVTKLVGVVAGEAFGAYVDARPGSESFGAVATVCLVPGVQVLVPSGVLNGFQCVSEGGCQYLYGFDAEWVPGMAGVAANALDPALAVPWPIAVDPSDRSLISEKDAGLPPFEHLPA